MALSNDLISQFVKVTQDKEQNRNETTVYGKIVKQGDVEYVQLDGSDLLTPISSTTVVKDGDRVMVTIKNHTAIVTGDLTNPSASDTDVKEIGNKISEFEIVIADKVATEQLEAEIAKIDKLIADEIDAVDGKFETIEAKVADIDTIKADIVEIDGKLTAHEGEFTTIRGDIADFKELTAEDFEAINGQFHNLESDYASFKDVTTKDLTAAKADITELDAKKIDTETANAKYANIDFSNIGEAAVEKLFSDSGIIKDLIMSDGKVTGELVGVTIKGDIIEGNTVKADKLVILGEDGLYYKLNVDALGETTASSDEKYQNGLDGSAILAESITAEKIAVDDLVAFGATIGGFHITDNSLYSNVKESVDNTTQGVFMGDDGQMNIGDGNNYLKYFIDENGEYKLEIQAANIKFGVDNKTIEEALDEVEAPDSIKYVEGNKLVIDDGIKIIDFKVDGISVQESTPSRTTPAVIKSLGYVNISSEKTVYGKLDSTGVFVDDSEKQQNIASANKIPVKPNTIYAITFEGYNDGNYRICEYDINQTYTNTLSSIFKGLKTFKTSSTTHYIHPYFTNNGKVFSNIGTIIQLEESLQAHTCIPYGKYGFQIRHRSKNLINVPENIETGGSAQYTAYIDAGKTYTISISQTLLTASANGLNQFKHRYQIYNYKSTQVKQGYFNEFNFTQVGETLTGTTTITMPAETVRLVLDIGCNNSGDSACTAITHYVQVEEGTEVTPCDQYYSNIKSFSLDNPLRSLPNGVKDTAYIEDDKLYIDRYVGHVVLNGSEDWKNLLLDNADTDHKIYHLPSGFLNDNYKTFVILDDPNGYCSHFIIKDDLTGYIGEGIELNTNYNEYEFLYGIKIKVPVTECPDVDSFKSWLTANNVEVQYELLEPITEEIGEFSIAMGEEVTNVYYVEDQLSPIIGCTYYTDYALPVKELQDVLDTTIKQITSLEIATDSINASVTEIKSTQESNVSALDSLSSDIDKLTKSVEASMTAEEVSIAIKSELDNGVSTVTTNTGFTFNDEGLTISKSGSEMTTIVDEDGMVVKRNDEERLIANNEGVIAYDLKAKTYLIIGENSRFQDYEKDGKKRTGCFWIGDTEV